MSEKNQQKDVAKDVDQTREYRCQRITLPKYRPVRSVDIPHPQDPRRLRRLKKERCRGIEYPPRESDLTNAPFGAIINRYYLEESATPSQQSSEYDNDVEKMTELFESPNPDIVASMVSDEIVNR